MPKPTHAPPPATSRFPASAARHPISQASHAEFLRLGEQEAQAIQLLQMVQAQIQQKARTIADEAGLPYSELLGADNTNGVFELVYQPIAKPKESARER